MIVLTPLEVLHVSHDPVCECDETDATHHCGGEATCALTKLTMQLRAIVKKRMVSLYILYCRIRAVGSRQWSRVVCTEGFAAGAWDDASSLQLPKNMYEKGATTKVVFKARREEEKQKNCISALRVLSSPEE